MQLEWGGGGRKIAIAHTHTFLQFELIAHINRQGGRRLQRINRAHLKQSPILNCILKKYLHNAVEF